MVGKEPDQDTSQGSRNDLEDFKTSVQEGILDKKELLELHSKTMAMFPRFVDQYIEKYKPKIKVKCFPLRPWQAELYANLVKKPDPREITFIVDQVGNQGKSWFARYFNDIHEKSQIVVPGKKADMAFTIDPDNKVFFFDCPRSKQGDFIQYDFLEELKNGYIFSPKYESANKKLEPPHVVVLMNEYPDMEKLSNDRYSVKVLS